MVREKLARRKGRCISKRVVHLEENMPASWMQVNLRKLWRAWDTSVLCELTSMTVSLFPAIVCLLLGLRQLSNRMFPVSRIWKSGLEQYSLMRLLWKLELFLRWILLLFHFLSDSWAFRVYPTHFYKRKST